MWHLIECIHIILYQSKHGSIIDKWRSAIYFKIHFLIFFFRRKDRMLDQPLYTFPCCWYYHEFIVPLYQQTNRLDIILFPWRVYNETIYPIWSSWNFKMCTFLYFTFCLSWLQASLSFQTRLVPWWPSSLQRSGEMNRFIPWKYQMDHRQFWNIFQASCVLATVVKMVIVHQVNI